MPRLHPAECRLDIGEDHAGGCGERVQHLVSSHCVLVASPADGEWPEFGDTLQLFQSKRPFVMKLCAQRSQRPGAYLDFADSGKHVIQDFTPVYKGVGNGLVRTHIKVRPGLPVTTV